ncbi:MAG: exodeoxyribonuclease III [Oscillospiraceae bacterium]|nr:exodeoxyribonuclease III [Oscillospiraceae bacterium]MBQ4485472.1 exodeoxyribonuclease III [Oscillospiraceae bacterium]MCR5807577.1 exodeoxyribonuclease III [Oscillospiraceae bacterium]
MSSSTATKIISWNVAGFRACLKKGFYDYFRDVDADIFCIQESKLTEEQNEFHPETHPYEYLYPAQKKGYSGTLIYSRKEPLSVRYGYGEEEYDNEGRSITLEFDDVYLVNVYVPNAKNDLSRIPSRMRFQDTFRDYLVGLKSKKNVIMCGDLNVAHQEIDIKNVRPNIGKAGFTYEERDKMTDLLAHGFSDAFRTLHPDKVQYTWWSYMGKARQNNVGWRIDYFVVNNEFMPRVKKCEIHDQIMGSDHCPILLEY